MESLRDDFLVRSTNHSNAIERSALTIYKTKAILEDGITIAGKSIREHSEAINHKQSIIVTKEIIKNRDILSEKLIEELHAIILHGIVI